MEERIGKESPHLDAFLVSSDNAAPDNATQPTTKDGDNVAQVDLATNTTSPHPCSSSGVSETADVEPDKTADAAELPKIQDAEDVGAANDGQPASSESVEEQSDTDDDDDDEEPRLKYQRVSAPNVQEIFRKDAASTILLTARLMIIGTHWGMVHVMDFSGNEIKKYRGHSTTINALSVDNDGEFVGSASDDGKVVVQNLFGEQQAPVVIDYKRPLKCLAIDPNYARSASRRIVSGGLAERLILYEKGWFGGKDTVIHADAGAIGAISWRSNLIAWADDTGVKMYDVPAARRITFIDRPTNSPRADLYRCRLRWRNDSVLLIGWANCIKVAVVKSHPATPHQTHPASLYVEIISVINTDFVVSGIAPYNNMTLVLSYTVDTQDMEVDVSDLDHQRRKTGALPELRILDTDAEEISADALVVNGHEFYQPNDYSLECASTGDLFYVLSPKDIVVAEARTLDDHLSWLLERELFEKALQCVQDADSKDQRPLNPAYTVEAIGQQYLAKLFSQERYETAATWCPAVLRADSVLWEQWVFAFAAIGQLKIIIPYLPTETTLLSSTVYEMVLVHFLNTDHQLLLQTLEQWPNVLYNIHSVAVAIEDAYSRAPESRLLMECLALLYLADHRPEKALDFYLRLGRLDTLTLVRDHNLFAEVQDKVYPLMLLGASPNLDARTSSSLTSGDNESIFASPRKPICREAVALLVMNTDAIPVGRAVEQLSDHREELFIYLDALFDADPTAGYEYHDAQVELCAEYAPSKLITFLRTSNHYTLEKAYDVCESRDLIPEMVYLLGRMGNNQKALALIIDRLADIQQAIEFAKEQNDADLWDDLLKYSIDKPVFIKELLESVGSHIDPAKLVGLIPKGLEIPGLKGGVSKILQDYNLQMSLQDDCCKILAAYVVELGNRQFSAQRRGIECLPETMLCSTCEGPLLFDSASVVNVVFFCGHAYHEFCLFDSGSPMDHTDLALGDGGVARKADAMLAVRLHRSVACPACGDGSLDPLVHGQRLSTHRSGRSHQLPPVERFAF